MNKIFGNVQKKVKNIFQICLKTSLKFFHKSYDYVGQLNQNVIKFQVLKSFGHKKKYVESLIFLIKR